MDTQFLTQWFGGAGAVFAVLFGLFKAIWPEIKAQLDTRSALKNEENRLRDREQQNTREMIEAVKVTNDLVAKNNEAFSNHNTLFSLHIKSIQDLHDHQRTIKGDLHRRTDSIEELLDKNAVSLARIETEQSAVLANLRALHGAKYFPKMED